MLHTFQVYSRYGCHLCDQMLEHLELLQSGHDFKFEVIDINGKPDLEARFGSKVPVLELNGEEVCHYFLDVERFSNLLQHHKKR